MNLKEQDRVAILILAHKNQQQIDRLIKTLDFPYFDLFIHIDKRYGDISKLVALENDRRIFFIKNREKGYLNTYSLVDITLKLMKTAKSRFNYKYYIILSAQDYPIKSNKYIYDFLMNSYPQEFIDYTIVEKGAWCENWGNVAFQQSSRKTIFDIIGHKYYFSKIGSILRAPVKLVIDKFLTITNGKPIDLIKKLGFDYAAGSHFSMLTDKSVDHILDIIKSEEGKQLISIFKFSPTPEESFFQTVLSTTDIELRKKKVPKFTYQDLLITRMDRDYLYRFIFDYKDGVSSGHPYSLSINEFSLLKNANSLFARKFDINHNNEIFNLIDKELRNSEI